MKVEISKIRSMQTVKTHIQERYPSMYPYLFDNRRSSHLYMLRSIAEKQPISLLDMGAGFGTLALQIAPRIKEYYAVDLDIQFQIQQHLVKISGQKNIFPIEGSMFDLNIDKLFDVVLLNGVLEWAGYYYREKSPQKAQIQLLNLIRSYLKKDGILMIGIENRFSPLYLITPDHNRLMYTSFLPRRLANWYTRHKMKDDYTTYTYTARGYETLLQEAGFNHVKVMGCYPNYRYPKLVFAHSGSVIHEMKKHFAKSKKQNLYFTLLQWKVFARMFSPCFIIFASKDVNIDSHLSGQFLFNGSGNSVKVFDLMNQVVKSYPRQLTKKSEYREVPYYRSMKPLNRWSKSQQIIGLQVALKKLDNELYHTPLYTSKYPEFTIHGDFYSGNILWDGNEVQILDYEYKHQGSFFYDIFTYMIMEVKHGGSQQIFKDFKAHQTQTVGGILRSHLNSLQLKLQRNYPIGQMVESFILEFTQRPERSISQYEKILIRFKKIIDEKNANF